MIAQAKKTGTNKNTTNDGAAACQVLTHIIISHITHCLILFNGKIFIFTVVYVYDNVCYTTEVNIQKSGTVVLRRSVACLLKFE